MALGFLLVAAVVTACVPLVSSVIYVPYIMEDACDGLPRTIQLPPTGPGSAIIMRSHQGAHYKSGLTCNFIVKTSNDYRIAVVFETLQFPGNSGNCSDSLLLSNVEDLSGPICTSAVKEVISKGNIMNVTWSTGGGAPATSNDGFEAVVTAYKPGNKFCSFSEFRCANQRCVADNFACDGHNNCGDNSDEKCSFARSVFRDWGYLILLGVGIVAINLCLIVPMVVRRVGSNSSDLQQQQQSRPNTPAPSELADEDKPSTSTTSDKCTTSSQPATTTTDSQSQAERKAARCKPTASSPASSRGSSKSPSGPASRQKQAAKVNGHKLTKKMPCPHPSSGRHQRRCRQRRHRSSSRQPLISPKTLGEPLSCSTYRCIRLPPGKTVSSEIVERSPIFHVYGAITGPTTTSGPAKNDSLSPKQSTHVDTSASSKPSTSPRSPAPDVVRTDAVTPAQRLPFQIVPKRPSTPPLYVLRSRSSLSQDNDVECGIREVSCGLERGPVFTPIQSYAFSTARRRAITPAHVHRTPRPERHQSSPRIASALPNTPPRGASMLPASCAPSQEGIDNKGYSSD